MLLPAGADPHETDSAGWTALTLGASNGYADVVDLLIRYGAEVDQKDPRGMSALMFAATNGHVAVIERLLVADKDREGRSALTLAARRPCRRGG
jgi:ankyrin repeat protein